MCVCVCVYQAYFKSLAKTDHFLPLLELGQGFFLILIREIKVMSKGPTMGLCLSFLCQLISASVESVDPPSRQNLLSSATCAAHQAMSFSA